MKIYSHKEENMGKLCNLANLKVGESARVVALNVQNKEIRRHLLDMGITRGVVVQVKKIAPMGDPIDIELRDYELCLRKADLSQIEAEVID
jgi:ferrous iron transport protein A